MHPIVSHNVLINGSRIAYGIHSPDDGKGHPVILIHGTPSSSLIWRNVVSRLVAAGYKVHVFDLLGYGLSERPWDANIDTSISGQVSVLEGLLVHWNLATNQEESDPSANQAVQDRATFHIVAHDIGGAVAQRFGILSRFRERMRSLTLIDSVSFDSYPSRRTKEQMVPGLDVLAHVSDAEHREKFREWLVSAVYHKQRFTSSEGSIDTFLNYISGPIGQASLFLHQVRHYDPKHTMEIADRLHELGSPRPVLLVWGANDEWQVPDRGRKLQRAIPGSRLELVEECGHFAPEDQPDRIAELVVSFWNEQTSTPLQNKQP